MASRQNETDRFQGVKYDQLQDPNSSPPSKKQSLSSKIWPFAAGIATAMIAFLVFQLVHSSSMPKAKTTQEIEDEEWNHCGRSSIDAMSRGCLMEPNFYGWFPSRCMFPELTDKYPVFEDRTWYSDVNLTEGISVKDLWEGKHVKIYTKRLAASLTTHPYHPCKLTFGYLGCMGNIAYSNGESSATEWKTGRNS